MNTLADELLVHTITFVPPEHLRSVFRTCRRWAALASADQNNSLWSGLMRWFPPQEVRKLDPLQLSWKSRFRLLDNLGRPASPAPVESKVTAAQRLAYLAARYAFMLELCDATGEQLAFLPVTLSDGLADPVAISSNDAHATEFHLSTELLLQTALAGDDSLEHATLPIGIGPAAAAGVGVGNRMPYGDLLARVFARRLSDGHVALFADGLHLCLDTAYTQEAPSWDRPGALTDNPFADVAIVSNWDHGSVPFAAAALPGDGDYALLQRDVCWNRSMANPPRRATVSLAPSTPGAADLGAPAPLRSPPRAPTPLPSRRRPSRNQTYSLGVGFEVECVAGRPARLFLGLFLLPGYRQYETDPDTWRPSSRADPEPIGTELLARILTAPPPPATAPSAGAPLREHLEWLPP